MRHSLLNKNLLLFYGAAGVGMFGHILLQPILPIFARRLGATGLEVGLLTSGFMLARGVIAFIIGKRIDTTGLRTPFVQVGFFILFVITFGYIFMSSYQGLLILRFCQGICSGMIWPVLQVMVVEGAERGYRTRALSLYQITGRIGALVSRLLLSIILVVAANIGLGEVNSFKIVFLVAGVVLFMGFVEVLLIPRQRKKRTEKRQGKPPYTIFLLGFVFGAMIALAPLSLVYLNEYYAISPVGIAVLLLILDIITVLVMYVLSHLSDRIGIKKSLWFILIPCLITAVCLPFAPFFTIFVILYFIMRMSISSFLPVSRSYATSADPEVGVNIGTLNMVSNLGSVIGPVIAGLLYDSLPGQYKIAGYSVIAMLLIPGIFIQLGRKNV
jgi:MFS family permease